MKGAFPLPLKPFAPTRSAEQASALSRPAPLGQNGALGAGRPARHERKGGAALKASERSSTRRNAADAGDARAGLVASPVPEQASPIRIALDGYDDLFSDFDGRPMDERLLSDDFLQELRRASLDRSEEGLALVLSLPRARRRAGVERLLRERLLLHVRRHRGRLEARLRADRRLGLGLLGLGVLLMLGGAALHHRASPSFLSSFVLVLLEPAGWFTFWEGLNLIIFKLRDAGPELSFYRKLAGAKLRFVDEAPRRR